ncbi:sickle tail protein-like isoform X1 [Chiloscyllium plagiosum]|uniref:sickle tail protein-like isoform X1 n=3 Tax=Chiloscyllium plagiosum TaxID=36176 RepID=UPI001CB80128|nr:sickle tail protein-like isoform X1 [Chiloscyllium plagiosum]
MSGNRVQFAGLPPPRDAQDRHGVAHHGKTNLRVTSADDAERIKAKQNFANGNNRTSSTKIVRNIPRRHTVGGARSSKEILGMQPSEMDRKREAFLEHLKQKYPHHANAIMGQQERLKEQTLQCMLASLQSELDMQTFLMKIEISQRSRSPKHLRSSQPGLGDQAEHLSVASADSFEAMAEPEASNTFNRGTRLRASLPVVRSTNQTKDRSLGVLYLQYGDEVTQFAMPNEITTMDTVHALFVRAFPKQLTMKMLESQNVAVYIKDEARNVFYELSDLRSIQDRALLKVYHKDPAHISLNHSSRAVNGDVRMQREMVHTKDAPPSFRHHGPLPHGPPSSPPIPQSMPPSPSRIPYNGGRTIPMPGSATVPRDRLSNMPPSRSISPSPSAILERRDVKPDEDLSGKNVALFRNEGLYADPYMYLDGRMSIASSSTGIPGDVPDHILYHRPSLRSGNTYPSTNVQADLMEQSLYRIKPRKYSDSYIPSIVSKTPPPSPQKISEMRIMDIHGQSSHLSHPVQLDRSCSIRSSLRKDSGTSIAMEAAAIKARSAASSPSVSDVIPFSADKQMSGYSSTSATPNDPETRERMKAMEKQIASLTGLVQSALFKGGNNAKEVPGEKIKATPLSSSEAQGATSAVALKSSGITSDSSSVVQPSPSCQQQIQNNVFDLRRNIFDLRQQLQHLRQSQLENQEMLRAMFKKAESEINSRVIEAMKRTEDPLQRQRIMVEEERQKYLVDEEKIVQQLCGLEKSIDGLSKDASSTQQTITLKDVEEGAVALRQVGECLAGLKAEFPTLQNKMRAVLRVEVEAVKFLKEEPHKLESLLKRVKSMTEVLTGLRRLVTEDLSRGTESKPSLQKSITETVTTVSESEMSKDSPLQVQEYTNFVQATGPQSPSGSLHEVQNSVVKSESHMVVHQVQSSPVQIHQSHHSSVLLHPTQGPLIMPKQSQNAPVTVQQVQSSPAVTKRSQESTDGITPIQSAPGHQFQSSSSTTQVSSGQNLFIDEIHAASTKKGIHRKMTIEAAEREWEEKRQNMNQYDEKEFERLLEEAQANMMKGIPSLEVEPEQKSITKLEEPDGLKQPEEIILPEQGNEKSMKSPPPPPPPRRFYPPGSGLTTTRSGEVIFTARKEGNPVTPEENSSAPLKSPRSPVEVKELALTSAPVEASAVKEDEDEGDRIMAELQAFQKCSVTDVSSKTVVEQPKVEIQAKDVRSTALLSAKEKKQRSGIADEQAIAMESEDQALLDSTVIPNDAPMTSNVFIFHNVHSQIELQSLNDTSVPSTYPKDTSKYLENEETPMPNKMHVHQSVVKEQNSTREREYVSAVEKKESDTDFKTESELKHFISPCTKLSTPQVNISTSEEVVGQNILSPLMRAHMTVPAVQHCTTILDQHDSVSNKFGHQGWEMPSADQSYQKESYSQQVILRPKNKGTVRYLEDVDSSSSSGEDSPSSDNIAFMITNTEVQALSSGEVIDLVNKKGEDIQTLNVDANREMTAGQEAGCEDSMLFTDKKPVIIIFDEPMDIRSAYKRLSTVFEECDEDLERMMAEERIDEESEVVEHSNDTKTLSESGMNNDELHSNRISSTPDLANNSVCNKSSGHDHDIQLSSAEINAPKESKSDPIESDDTKSACAESLLTNKADNKKKFKFKFPKKQLAALTQAIKTGTKTGKKTLQVVVYEDEEELDGTVKQHKEAKRFEIVQANCKDEASTKTMQSKQHNSTDVIPNSFRTDQIRKNTYKTLDSLEQTIKQLETTISEMSPKEEDYINYPSQSSELSQGAMSWNEIKSTEQLLLSSAKAPQNTKTKPPLLPKISTKTSESQSSHLMSPSSRMPVSVGSKLRHQQGTTEKVTKQKLQDPQRQFRQANGSAKKAGGESKVTSPTLPASKIPALSSSSGKSSSVPGPSNDNTNHLNTSSKYPLSTANSVAPTAGRNVQIPSVSHIPSTSNGSLKLHAQNSALTGRGQPLSFPLHTPNGRPSPSSSSPSTSPVSPTSLTQGAKSIRTIHTASFASYKQQNVNQSKFTMAAVKETA